MVSTDNIRFILVSMKFSSVLIVIVALAFSVQCYVFNNTVPLVEGKCSYASELKSKDEIWYNPNFCERLTCQVEGDKAYIVITDCGVPSVPDRSCVVSVGEGNFPDCCPKISCNNTTQ